MTAPEPPLLLRVEKGQPDLVELAALAAVLRARSAVLRAQAAAPAEPVARPSSPKARWRRPERGQGFAGARTWRVEAHERRH